MKTDEIESPLKIPTTDAAAPVRSNETQIDDSGRPFVVVDGRRYVLAADEPEIDLGSLLENPKLAQIPAPPRDVSTVAKLALFFGLSLTSTFGWIWLCFSSIFAAVFFGGLGIGTSFYEKIGAWERFASARLVSCESSNFSVNGRSAQVWKFEGTASDGSTFQGRSYSFEYREPGGEVEIERRKGTTNVLRVRGTSIAKAGSSPFTTLAPLAVISIFLAIGVCLALVGPIRRGLKTLPILRRGIATQGVPVDVSETGTRMNQTSEMRVTYRFQSADGNDYKTFAKGFNVDKLTDEPAEVLLYDPEKPQNSFVFDALPKGVKLLPSGRFEANPMRLILPLIFATIFIAEIAVTAALAFRIDRATFSPVGSASAQAVANAEEIPNDAANERRVP